MAEENTQEVAPKSSKTMLIVVLVVVINLIIGGVVVVVFVLGGKNSESDKPAAAAVAAPTAGPGTLIPMDNFVVNVKGAEGAKYLKASIVLEMKAEKSEDLFGRWEKLLRNEVLVYLSSLEVEDTVTVKQKRSIEKKLREILNKRIGIDVISGAYFTEFVTQ